mgnify:CR=1 FL=1
MVHLLHRCNENLFAKHLTKNRETSMNSKDNTKDKEIIKIEDVSDEAVVTIRCLGAIPQEVEALLAEIVAEEVDENELK